MNIYVLNRVVESFRAIRMITRFGRGLKTIYTLYCIAAADGDSSGV